MSVDRIVESGIWQALTAGGAVRQSLERGTAQAAEAAKMEQLAQQIESYLRSVSRSLEFRVDAASGRTVVSVRDAQSGELIRQIPSEEVLRLAQMAEDQTVVLVNEKV